MNLKTELLEIARALGGASIPYALCGGLAVVLHGYPRLTRDIDLLVRTEDLDRAREALAPIGFSLPGGIIPFDVGTDRERRIFRVSKRSGSELLTIDLLIVPAYLEDVWDGREMYEVDGVPVRVVSHDGLLRMKRIAGRPQDLADIEALESDPDAT